MAIQWTGLFANTGYSSANNKTQDDAVTGMQDTLYVTGPGYGAYEAVVKLHSSTGAVVATVNVSGGGGAFSAPPPVRFVDNGTVYSYSLEVVRGFIPTEDADGIVIRLVGGASKRYPSPLTSTPSGDVAVPGAILAPNTVPTKPNASWSPFPIGNVSLSSTTGAVGQLIARMPCEFSRVGVWAGNNSGAPVTAITKILAAVSATEGWIPSVGGALTEDQTTGWITADPDGITVPAASASIGAQEVPSYGPSAIFEISSIPAGDGGRPWLFLRHPWAAANIGYRWLESSDHLYNPQDLTGSYSRYRRVVNADYSYCAANTEAGGTALAAAPADNYLCPIFRIDVWSTKDGWVTFDAIGGSTFSQTANNSETYALSWVRKANAEMIGDTANIVTLGVSGATTAHYYAMAQKAIAMSHSQYILYSVFSGNDGSFAQAAVDAMMRRFFSVKNLARDAGKMAIPVVMIHDSVGGNSGLNAIRNAAVAQLEAAGPVLNLGDILGQASNKNLFVPAYTTDGVHFSQAGNDRATAWLPGALQDIRNRFPVW